MKSSQLKSILRLQRIKPRFPKKRVRLLAHEKQRLSRLKAHERALWRAGYHWVAGVDEAGRGALAGPVVAAACRIPEGLFFAGINDSKVLTPQQRERLFIEITSHEEVDFGFGCIGPEIIDRINILQASLEAMRLAIGQLKMPPDALLIDGLQAPRVRGFAECVVGGDRKCYVIAAASILAKWLRDEIMKSYDQEYPGYGFAEHKGYATKQCKAAFHKQGPCLIARMSFAPIKNYERKETPLT